MSDDTEFLCFGDVMLECILPVGSLPAKNATFVADGKPLELGGTAYNLCWYLSQWNWSARLAGFYGRRQEDLIRGVLALSGIDSTCLLPVEGDSDLFQVFLCGADFLGTYLRSGLPAGSTAELLTRCGRPRRLILAGSRHRALRDAATAMAQAFHGEWLAFCPSYSIYDYDRDNFAAVLGKAQVTALNESEVQFACSLLELSSPEELAARSAGCLVMTLGEKGVRIIHAGGTFSLGSFSGVAGDVVGAGDALFAGFLHVVFGGGTIREAAVFGSIAAAEQIRASVIRAHIPVTVIEERTREIMIKA